MKITRFEDIEAWKAARRLTRLTYDATGSRTFSRDQDLRRQMIRSAGSAMANIAEGFDSGSDAEFVRFLRISQRSAEFQSHLYVASDRARLDRKRFDELYSAADATKRLIGSFIRYLQASSKSSRQRTKDNGPRTIAE